MGRWALTKVWVVIPTFKCFFFSLVVGRTRLIFTELPYRVNSGVSMFAQPNKLFEIGYVEWFFFWVKLSGVDG